MYAIRSYYERPGTLQDRDIPAVTRHAERGDRLRHRLQDPVGYRDARQPGPPLLHSGKNLPVLVFPLREELGLLPFEGENPVHDLVITSYSIHYTKLYDGGSGKKRLFVEMFSYNFV